MPVFLQDRPVSVRVRQVVVRCEFSARAQFNSFHVHYFTFVQREPKEGSDGVKSVGAAGPGIEAQCTVLIIPQHAQHMRVTANE